MCSPAGPCWTGATHQDPGRLGRVGEGRWSRGEERGDLLEPDIPQFEAFRPRNLRDKASWQVTVTQVWAGTARGLPSREGLWPILEERSYRVGPAKEPGRTASLPQERPEGLQRPTPPTMRVPSYFFEPELAHTAVHTEDRPRTLPQLALAMKPRERRGWLGS